MCIAIFWAVFTSKAWPCPGGGLPVRSWRLDDLSSLKQWLLQTGPNHATGGLFCQRRWRLSPDTVTLKAGAWRNPQSPKSSPHHWRQHCHAIDLQISSPSTSSSSLLCQ